MKKKFKKRIKQLEKDVAALKKTHSEPTAWCDKFAKLTALEAKIEKIIKEKTEQNDLRDYIPGMPSLKDYENEIDNFLK